jgi:5-carboxymethyl-2-hydroxymuconate isomerase
MIPLNLGLFVQNRVQQRIMNLYLSIVADESKFATFVHEVAHAGSGRSNHLCRCFLADIH